jgi:hypothetical protein
MSESDPVVVVGYIDETEYGPREERLTLLELLSRSRDLIVANGLDKERGHDAGLCDCCDIGLITEIDLALNGPADPDDDENECPRIPVSEGG